jgi:CD109 antigen
MQGGAGGGIALTAYTLIAFLENKDQIPKYKNTINKAIDYVFRNSESLDDNYALALAAYALQLAQHSGKDFILTKLDGKATSDAGHKWWHKAIPKDDEKNVWNNQPNAVNVEMTAYGLLTFIEASQETLAIPILKWLVAQRNEKGGFQSTQDTVVGLQALAKFAEKISAGEQNVQITVGFREGAEHNINVNRENSLVLQSYELPPNTRDVQISATGHGFAIVQISYKYHTNVTGAWPRFNLDPQVNKNSNSDYLHLTVCTSFVPAGGMNESNMAVMEVAFPSGFTADLDTLPSLEQTYGIKVS